MKITHTDYPLQNKWMQIRHDTVSLPTRIADYYTMEGPEWVNICAVTPQHEILFVNQYRVSLHREHLELPAGKMDKEDETPHDAVRREFSEETGHALAELHYLGPVNTIAGRSNVKGHLFCGRTQGVKGDQHLDDTEDIKVAAIPIAEVMRMIQAGEFTCLCSLATILLAKEKYPHLFQSPI